MNSKNVSDCIMKIINKIDAEPFLIHRECDIQAMIYNEVFNKLHKKNDNIVHIALKDEKDKNYRTNLVHCEYFFGKKENKKMSSDRFDIVIFNKEDVKNINTHWLRIKNNNFPEEIVKLDHVIEIKFESGLGGKKALNFKDSAIKKDIDKLIKFKKLHCKYKKHIPKLHFVYVLRLWKANEKWKSKIPEIIKKADELCKKNEILFYNNCKCFLD